MFSTNVRGRKAFSVEQKIKEKIKKKEYLELRI